MNDHDNDVNQVQDEDQDFRKKVATALSKPGTVEELQAHPDDAMTLHLNEDEAVLMRGAEVDAWLAEEDNRMAYFDELEDRKKEDAERERDMASTYDVAEDDIGEFSMGEDRPNPAMSKEDTAINNRVWDQYRQKANQEQDRSQDVEPYDQTKVGDNRLYDIRGNVVTAQQIDDIMRSRAELKQHLDEDRQAAQKANGYDRDAVRQKDQEQAKGVQADYHQAVGAEATANRTPIQMTASTWEEPATKAHNGNSSSSSESSTPSRGDLVRARAAQYAAEPEEVTKRKQEQTQSR